MGWYAYCSMASQSQLSTKYTWISCIRRENGSPEPQEIQVETSEPKSELSLVEHVGGALVEFHAQMSEQKSPFYSTQLKESLCQNHHWLGVRQHLQNVKSHYKTHNRKTPNGTISPTFVSPRLLGPQLVPGDDFGGGCLEGVNEVDQIQRHETPSSSHLISAGFVSWKVDGFFDESLLFDKSEALFELSSHPALCTL